MPTIQALLDETGLTLAELSRLANVDYRTAQKLTKGGTITRVKLIALLKVLNGRLNTSYQPEDIILIAE